MEVIVDRFEGDQLIVELEPGKFTTLSRLLAPEAQEGDVIRITIDPEATAARRRRVSRLMDKLFQD